MSSVARAAALLAMLTAAAAGSTQAAAQPPCPDDLAQAQRLVLVLGATMNASAATVRLFERGSDGAWKSDGGTKGAVIGRNGLAWSWAHKHYAGDGEPVKTEGDARTPAGFFMIGKPFGFSPKNRPDRYVRLQAGEHYCVDDPQSPHYNAVVSKTSAGGATGEDMASIGLYRQGLFVDYPTNRSARGGSCIFVHVWRRQSSGTVGCVALAEADVTALQDWADEKQTMIGIFAKNAWSRLRTCFPGSDADL